MQWKQMLLTAAIMAVVFLLIQNLSFQGIVNFVHAYYWPLVIFGIVLVSWPLLIKPGFLTLLEKFDMKDYTKYTDWKKFKEIRKKQAQNKKKVDPGELFAKLNERIIGQEELLEKVSQIVATNIRRTRPNKPICSVLVTGPTGVGKTELGKALCEAVYGDEKLMARIDCGQPNAEDIFFGSPSGFVGSQQGGRITNQLRDCRGKTLILIDEFNRAVDKPNHGPGATAQASNMENILFTLLDEGYLTERSTGQQISATESIVIATTNVGSEDVSFVADRYKDNYDELEQHVVRQMKKHFDPATLERFDLVTTTKPFDEEAIAKIAIKNITDQAEECSLRIGEDGVDGYYISELVNLYQEAPERGIRKIRNTIESQLRGKMLDAEEADADEIIITYDNDEPGVHIITVRNPHGSKKPSNVHDHPSTSKSSA